MSPNPATPNTMPMITYKRPFNSNVVPGMGDPGIRPASPTMNPAMPIRNMTNAASTTSAPKIVIPNGRTKPSPPHGKEEQDGNASGAERRAQITPTGLCHSSTTPLLPEATSDGGHKTIPIPATRRGVGAGAVLSQVG